MSSPALLSQLHDDEGAPVVAGELYCYAAGTTTLKTVYADLALTTPLENPVELDAAGRLPQLFFEAGRYKFVLRSARIDNDTPGEVIFTQDNWEAIGAGLPDEVVSAISALAPVAPNLARVAQSITLIDNVGAAIADPVSNLNKAAALGSVSEAKLTSVADNIAAIVATPKNASLGDYADLVSNNTPITSYNDTFTTESGARRWTVPLTLTLPFTPSGAFDATDWKELLGSAEVTDLAFQAMLKRLRRLETYHPSVAPTMSAIANQSVEEGTSGTLLNLALFVADDDSDAADLDYSVTSLPTGFSLSGALISYAAPTEFAPTSVTATVTDESGLTASRTFQIEVYETGSAPTVAPVFNDIPDITITKGDPVSVRNHKDDVVDTDSNSGQITIAATVSSDSGVTFTDGVRGGTAGEVGTYSVSLTATDQDANEVSASYDIIIVAAASPTWTQPPNRSQNRGGSAIILDLKPYFQDANTPDSELGASLSLSGAPSGTTKSGGVITLPTNQGGTFNIYATVTNRGGVSATSPVFQFTILDPQSGGGGSAGNSGNPSAGLYEDVLN